jgi:hypothetical protein
MRGSEVLTTEDSTQVTWVLRAPHNAPRTRLQPATAGISDRNESLRAKLIAASVEVAANGSNPRLQQSRHMRIAP